jgi:hypothetical protein
MIDATHLKAHRTAVSLLKNGQSPAVLAAGKAACIEAAHVCDDTGKPVRLLLTEGQVSDDTGARRLLSSLPKAKHMIADRDYDADWLITAVKKQSAIFYPKE